MYVIIILVIIIILNIEIIYIFWTEAHLRQKVFCTRNLQQLHVILCKWINPVTLTEMLCVCVGGVGGRRV